MGVLVTPHRLFPHGVGHVLLDPFESRFEGVPVDRVEEGGSGRVGESHEDIEGVGRVGDECEV